MDNNTSDQTLKKNYIQKYQYLVEEYELVKAKRHTIYKTVQAFYKAHGTCGQTFLKYYNRYLQSGRNPEAFLPGKRGPKFKTRRPSGAIEALVLEEREKGCNRYEIHDLLKIKLKSQTPSPSGIYNILKRYGKNKLKPPMKEEKRRIIKEKAGELAHIDCHHIAKDTIAHDHKRYYIVCVIDSCSRIAWAEVVDNAKALTVMFGVLRCLNQITNRYAIQFAEALTDNGPEFGPKQSQKKEQHPFERLLQELGIQHRYTQPYRPQTNGKVERFWRSLKSDLIDGTYFESIDHFKDELFQYMLYYNQLRPHQGLEGKTPKDFLSVCQRIT